MLKNKACAQPDGRQRPAGPLQPGRAGRQGVAARMVIRLGLLAGLAGALAFPAGAADVDMGELLRRADASRNTNPRAFMALVDRLRPSEGTLTAGQRNHYRLLRAYQHSYRGRYGLAAKEASALFREAIDPNIKFRAGVLVINNAAITRDYSMGLRFLSETLELDDGRIATENRNDGLLVTAVLYNQLGQYALGQHFAEQVLAREPTPKNRCVARHLRVEAMHGLGSWPKGDGEAREAIAECVAQKDVVAANFLRGNLARRMAAQGDAAAAAALLEQHLPEVEATGYPRLIGEMHGLLAEYKLILGDVAHAEQHAREALAKGGQGDFSLPLVVAHKVLYESALRRRDVVGALEQYRRYAEADKARLDEIKAREFAVQLSRLELQQKNQAIELLRKQNEVLRLEQEVSQAGAQNQRLLTALLGMVLLAITLWAYKVKRVQVAFRRASEVDGLTGISNRRHFRHGAEGSIQRCAGAGREAALVLLDLDNFKRINDEHGHAIGDWVLQQVALACQAACREGDVCGRLGGEEFAILSCGSDLAAARRIAQRCRENLAGIDTSVIGLPVTASFGCTTTARSGYAFETMFSHADAAMYQAKAGGRDRIRAYGEDGVGPAAVLELVRG